MTLAAFVSFYVIVGLFVGCFALDRFDSDDLNPSGVMEEMPDQRAGIAIFSALLWPLVMFLLLTKPKDGGEP